MSIHTTEKESAHKDLHLWSIQELVLGINSEDHKVAISVEAEIPSIVALAEAVYEKMQSGGRLFYIGSGTSGRLGIVDASECPPTYGVPHGWVVGIIAGGDQAIRKAVEHAEDDMEAGWRDLQAHHIHTKDVVIGISASGKTPYVCGALRACREVGISTGSISCNKNSDAGKLSDFKVEVEVGPEFVTGSTRMKAGTAQKMVLNMITTSVMIRLGRVKGNKMVDMQLTNAKLVQRGILMIMDETGISEFEARQLLGEHGNVRAVLNFLEKK